MKNIVEILSIPFTNTTKKKFIKDEITPRLKQEKKTFIVTANPEIVEYANDHPKYKDIICTADYITPDGIGVILASRWMKEPLQERVSGFDMMKDLFSLADKNGFSVYLLGAEESVIEEAANKVQFEYTNIELAGYHHGYIDINDAGLAKKIARQRPDIVLVALGFPRQEKWIHKHYHLFEKGIFMGVGGSFDVLAGKVKRAPVFWQKANLEWLYRLIQQPARWRRMLMLPRFALKVMIKSKRR
ncbi:WecB/TagA/CpsF family glycosyltransferase [Bacillus massiliglaciei]|uniref:WecB/TagA/CpsF family glycosyltransferase n=1 Tax=Bacillus massiliglaciei TaxID=1816693 RepID=UPI000AA1AD38|nr:WecB/TagA/CpsF family glycosyltransferase [Bacillus massiliglaciei]